VCLQPGREFRRRTAKNERDAPFWDGEFGMPETPRLKFLNLRRRVPPGVGHVAEDRATFVKSRLFGCVGMARPLLYGGRT
jgi:hypothetical protein